MDELAWLMLALGAMMLVLGLVAMLGLVNGVPRLEGLGTLLFGVGILLHGLAGVPGLSAEGWLPWLGIGCSMAGLVLLWRSGRRGSVAHRQPTAGAPH